MGFLSGGGSATESNMTIGPAFKHQYAAWLNYVDPTGDTATAVWGNYDDTPSFNMRTMLEAMATSNGGNPYTNLEAVDPTEDLALINKRMKPFLSAVDELAPDMDMGEALRMANRFYDKSIVPEAQINASVNAFEQRTRRRHLQAAMRVRDGYGMADAGLSSTMRGDLVALEADRAQEVNNFEQALRLRFLDTRQIWVLDIASRQLASTSARIDALRAAAVTQYEVSKLNIVAKQDRQEKDIEFELQDAFWDPNLIKEGMSLLQLGSGLPIVPRSPTKAERLIQQVLTSVSFANQFGTAMGSPAAGVAGGVVLLALNLLANRSQG